MGLILQCNFAVKEDDVKEKEAAADAVREQKKKINVDSEVIMNKLNQ